MIAGPSPDFARRAQAAFAKVGIRLPDPDWSNLFQNQKPQMSYGVEFDAEQHHAQDSIGWSVEVSPPVQDFVITWAAWEPNVTIVVEV